MTHSKTNEYETNEYEIRGLSQKFVDFPCDCFISCADLQNCAYFQRIIYFLSNFEISEWYVRSLWLSEQIYNHSNASSSPSEISDTYTHINRPSTIHMLTERHQTSSNYFTLHMWCTVKIWQHSDVGLWSKQRFL